MNRMRMLPLVAALTMQTAYFPEKAGGALPAAPPPLAKHDIERLEAAVEKRRRRHLKRSKTLQGGVHGGKLCRVVTDELVES